MAAAINHDDCRRPIIIYTPVPRPTYLRRGLETGQYRYDDDGQLERRCAHCGEYWPADTEFYNKRGTHLQSWCRACQNYHRRSRHARSEDHLDPPR